MDAETKFKYFSRVQILLLCLCVALCVCVAVWEVLVYTMFHISHHVPVVERCSRDDMRFSIPREDFDEEVFRRQWGVQFPPEAFFSYNNRTRVCPCSRVPCVPKCCGFGERLFLVNNTLRCFVVNTKERFGEEKFKFRVFNYTESGLAEREEPGEFLHFPLKDVCNDYDYSYQKLVLMKDGSVLAIDKFDKASEYIDLDDYCMDYAPEYSRPYILKRNCSNKQPVDLEYKGLQTDKNLFYVVCFLLFSANFLSSVSTLVVYGLISQLRNLQGKMLISYMICLIGFQLAVPFDPESSPVGLFMFYKVAYVTDFMFLGYFSWLTVVGFDLWFTFSRPLQSSTPNKTSNRTKFLLYSAFAWGYPTLILIFVVIITLKTTGSCAKPRFPDESCLFDKYTVKSLFVYVPGMALLALNAVMVLSTFVNLRWLHGNPADALISSDSIHRPARKNFIIYVKLSLSMGIQYLLFVNTANLNNVVFAIFYMFSIFTNGIPMCVMLVYNKRVLRAILQNWHG